MASVTEAALTLLPQPLSAAAFAAFGDVIETAGRPARLINQGTARRFDDLAQIDVAEQSGRALVSLWQADARALPFEIRMLERHPLSSQAFIPLDALPFLIVVATASDLPRAADVQVFRSSGAQGVNYRRNTWHHPLLALTASRFVVIDRGGPEENCEERDLSGRVLIQQA